ncbi:MAG: hypothetical protein D6732_21065 [Methanobacteriota archaeon]|nr:MAG: hypothetical protein D6732_21065 [Euryarchaeota archaeon]
MPLIRKTLTIFVIFGLLYNFTYFNANATPTGSRYQEFRDLLGGTIGDCIDTGYDIVDNQILEIRNSIEMKFVFICTNGMVYERPYADTSDILLSGGRFIRDDPQGRLVYLWEYRSATTSRAIDLEFHLYRVVLTGTNPPGGTGGCMSWEFFGKTYSLCN